MATSAVKQTCAKCGRTMSESFFYTKRDKTRATLCRDCLTMYIDTKKPSTFKWILEDLDYPYIESIWVDVANKVYKKDPANFGPRSVFGTYLRTMKMNPWNQHGYADSEMLEAQRQDKKAAVKQIQQEFVAEDKVDKLKQKLEKGEISEAQYRTLATSSGLLEKKQARIADLPKDVARLTEEDLLSNKPAQSMSVKNWSAKAREEKSNAANATRQVTIPQETAELLNSSSSSSNPSPPGQQQEEELDLGFTEVTSEESIAAELTKEDIKYLALKWGTAYKPTEWIKLEEMYKKYESEYELNVDRAEVLQSVCKTKLKMDQSLDIGDFKTYKDLSAVYDQLRRSGKFTESQNVETQKREIDSIGELVAFVETQGGIIPRFEDPENEPQDKIDFLINDIKSYVNNLVRNELGLGNLIESYVKKLKEQEVKTAKDLIEEGINLDEDEGDGLTQAEAEEFQAFQMDEIEEESRRLVEAYGAL